MDGNAEVILDVCDWDIEELRKVLTDILSVSLVTKSAGKEGGDAICRRDGGRCECRSGVMCRRDGGWCKC